MASYYAERKAFLSALDTILEKNARPKGLMSRIHLDLEESFLEKKLNIKNKAKFKMNITKKMREA